MRRSDSSEGSQATNAIIDALQLGSLEDRSSHKKYQVILIFSKSKSTTNTLRIQVIQLKEAQHSIIPKQASDGEEVSLEDGVFELEPVDVSISVLVELFDYLSDFFVGEVDLHFLGHGLNFEHV